MRVWLLALVGLFGGVAAAQELAFVPSSPRGLSYADYMTQENIPSVLFERECGSRGQGCWYSVVNQAGRQIRRFGGDHALTSLGEGRYRKIGYLLLSHGYPCGKDWCDETLLIDSDGRFQRIGEPPWGKALALKVGAEGALHAITEQGFITRGNKGEVSSLAAPEPLYSASIGANTDGRISAVAVAESGRLYWSDGGQWQALGPTLTASGDRKGIAAVYPWRDDAHYIVFYRYINEYNKGLYSFRFNPVTGEEEGGWLFNSEHRNIGFDPDIYRRPNETIVVSAMNSSADRRNFFQLSEGDFSRMSSALPEHLVGSGLETEKEASFMVGAGISRIAWVVNSSVESDGVTYTDVDYLISDSLLTSINLEGRIGSTSLTINYLQNQAESLVADEVDSATQTDQSSLSKGASSYLFSTIDFQGLLSPSSVLRIQAEISDTTGVAKIRQRGAAVAYENFSTELRRIAVLSMQERGFFMGVDYIRYRMPSALGFSDSSKQIVYSGFDPDFGFQAVRLVGGYDALAYAKRYETDYHRFYLAGSGNIGLGWADVSSTIETQALAATGEDQIDSMPIYFTAGVDLEGGYLWQQRFKRVRGLGYSIGVGYRVTYSILGVGQSEDSEPDAGTLYLEFDRSDMTHGPFLKGNILF